MEIINVVLLISIFISLFFQIVNYKYLTKLDSISFSFVKILIVTLIFCFIYICNIVNMGVFKAPICFSLIVLANKVIYDDSLLCSFFTSSISYVIVVIVEILLSIVTINFKIIDYNSFYNNSFLILFFSFITNFLSYLCVRYLKILSYMRNKIKNYFVNKKIKIYIIFIFFLILLLIDFKYIINFDLSTYFVNFILLILMLIVFYEHIKEEVKFKSELEKIDILLDNISKYEIIIDNNRINNHEMLNNLILLKSYKNKNSKKFDELLNSMIGMYDKNNDTIKNINILPKNLKGIIYYKLFNLESYGLKVNVNISKRIVSYLENIDENDYIILCRIIPILLDNAISAAKDSKEKKLIVDFYKENNSVIISIENSCDEIVNISKINRKFYSTKGLNRGLGLYIVNKLLTESKLLKFIQCNNANFFISKITIKNKMD